MRGRLLVIGGMAGTIAILCAVPAALGAATRFASPNGSGPPTTCPQSDPCDLQTAVEDGSVMAGDTVVLLPGTYSGGDGVAIEKDITVHGQTGHPPPTIESSADAAVHLGDPGAFLSDVRIQQRAGTVGALYIAAGTADRVFAKTTAAGGRACSGYQATFRDTVCWHAVSSGPAFSFNLLTSGANTILLRNVTAVASGPGSDGIFFALPAATSATSTLDGKSVIAQGTSNDVEASSSSPATATVTLDHSNFSTVTTGGDSATVTDPNTSANQLASPRFVDVPHGDFHEFIGSPTINAGVLDGLSGSADIDGDPRTIGPAPDIGADEFDRTPPKTTITKHPKKSTASRNASFKFKSNEVGSTFRCKLDRKRFHSCRSPKSYKHLTPGKHRFSVKATDPAGKTDPTPASFRWKVKR